MEPTIDPSGQSDEDFTHYIVTFILEDLSSFTEITILTSSV